MPSYDEMISHHAVTQGSWEAASDVSGSAVAASYILQSRGTSELPFLKVKSLEDIRPNTANTTRRFPGKFTATFEEVIMENTEERDSAKGPNTYPTSCEHWRHDTDMGVTPCNMFLWFQIE